jgi:DNA invertase Pin-like site-specific DNA recombinase
VRIVAYTRVSTVDQGESGLGLEAQRRKLQLKAELEDWDLVWESDTLSGRNLDRPGLQRALEMCGDGRADGICVATLDRISRSVVDFGTLMKRAKDEGWNLVALDYGLDLHNPAGKLVANIMVSVAEWERERIGQRVSEALRRKPGYTYPEDVRQRAKELREERWPLWQVAQILTQEGHRPLRGKRITVGSVRAMLR